MKPARRAAADDSVPKTARPIGSPTPALPPATPPTAKKVTAGPPRLGKQSTKRPQPQAAETTVAPDPSDLPARHSEKKSTTKAKSATTPPTVQPTPAVTSKAPVSIPLSPEKPSAMSAPGGSIKVEIQKEETTATPSRPRNSRKTPAKTKTAPLAESTLHLVGKPVLSVPTVTAKPLSKTEPRKLGKNAVSKNPTATDVAATPPTAPVLTAKNTPAQTERQAKAPRPKVNEGAKAPLPVSRKLGSRGLSLLPRAAKTGLRRLSPRLPHGSPAREPSSQPVSQAKRNEKLPKTNSTLPVRSEIPADLFGPKEFPKQIRQAPSPDTRRPIPDLPAKLWEGDNTPLVADTGMDPEGEVPPFVEASVPATDSAILSATIDASSSTEIPAKQPPLLGRDATPIRLWLTPRDPFSLMAHWDCAPSDLARRATHWGAGEWMVRVYLDQLEGTIGAEALVHSLHAHLFIPVLYPDRRYVAELGYRTRAGLWRSVATSESALTPTDAAVGPRSSPEMGRFQARIQSTAAAGTMAPTERSTPNRATRSLAGNSIANQIPASPKPQSAPDRLAQLILREFSLRKSGSSGEVLEHRVEVLELSREPKDLSSILPTDAHSLAALGEMPSSEASLSPPAAKGFWFEVNAELIVHGRTEPGARVTLGGRPVALRPDGSFTYRFALPDGDFALPAVAISAVGDDTRAARLHFTRGTQREGEVGHHPLAAVLRPPIPDAID